MSFFRRNPSLPKNRSMPPGVVFPVLRYPDVREAVAWLCRVFGCRERLQIEGHRSQLTFGEGSVIVTGRGPERRKNRHEKDRCFVMVRVSDVDAHFARALKAGADIVRPLADFPYGERQYTARDLEDHEWTFTQTIADVAPEAWGGTLVK